MRIRRCYILTAVLAVFCLLTVITISAAPTLRANGKIAFTSDRDGNREIYSMNPDGTDQVRLTNNTLVDDHATWSPDGKQIAFVSEKTPGVFAIFRMNADGTNKVEITPLVFNAVAYPIWDAWGMSWSPDGAQIAFQQQVGPSTAPAYPNHIVIVDIDGKNRHILGNNPSDDRQPAWSPDGSKILFSRAVDEFYHHLFTVKPDGSDLHPLASNAGDTDLAATWSPTGDKIAFQLNDTVNFENIAIVNANGSGRFSFDSGSLGSAWGGRDKPEWSPDGNKIVFHVTLGASGTWDTQIFVKNIDGDINANGSQVSNPPGNNFKPSWQPISPNVSISGKVTTPDGRGLRNAMVTLTDSQGQRRTVTTSSFGFYSFANIPPGATYTISVASRLYRFTPRTITVNDNLTAIDFIGLE